MKTSSITSIVAACLSAGGAMVGYIFLRPKNLGDYLKWQGHELASSDNDALWESIYEENKEIFKKLFPKEEGNEQWKKIKKYCVDAVSKSNYDNQNIEDARQLCVDNVKTVKGQLIKNKRKVDDFMETKEEFKTATAVQGNDKFWALIEAEDSTLEKRAEAYQRWCVESLKSKPKDDLVQNVDNFCHRKGYSDFQSKLIHEGYQRLSDKEIENQYTKLGVDKLQKNTGSNWIETIGGGSDKWVKELGVKANPWSVDQKKFTDKYKEYCKSGDTKTLFDEDNYPKKFSEYRAICAKKGDKLEINEDQFHN